MIVGAFRKDIQVKLGDCRNIWEIKRQFEGFNYKLELKKKYQIISSIKIAERVDLNDDESTHLEKFIDWINKILIQTLKASHEFYKDKVKKISKDLEKYDHEYYSCFDKE